jgi:chemosensory pili system protein ChpC
MNSPITTDTLENSNEIPSLLIPMSHYKLVLPTVSVAEMIPYQAPKPYTIIDNKPFPDWYMGTLVWRGTSVPMVSFEKMNKQISAPINTESQLLILNNTGVSNHLPFICMPTQGIPRLSRIAMNEISQNTQISPLEYEIMQVFVAGEQAVIPDVGKLETACVDLLGY